MATKKKKVETQEKSKGFFGGVFFFSWESKKTKVLAYSLSSALFFGAWNLFAPEINILVDRFQFQPSVYSPTEPLPQGRVAGVQDEPQKIPGLSPFDIEDWTLERGLFIEDGSICSRGRNDRPILTASYNHGLSVGDVAVINFSVHEHKKVKTGEQQPKAILVYGNSMVFFPSPDPGLVIFDDENKPNQPRPRNKLPELVDIAKPMMLVFEPSRLIANKLAFKYNFRYQSTDPEIPESVTSLGSFESYQDDTGDGLPRKLAFGLYVGTCIKISSFDTSVRNGQIQSDTYFK